MKVKTSQIRSSLFGVDVLEVDNEFSEATPDVRLFDLRRFGVTWVPVIGRTVCRQRGCSTQWHVHKGCVEIIYCISGCCDYQSCGKRFVFSSGSLFISRPDEPHRQVSPPRGYSTFYLLFKPSLKPTADEKWYFKHLRALPRLLQAKSSVRARFTKIISLLGRGNTIDAQEMHLRLKTEVMSLLLEILDSPVQVPCKKSAEGTYRCLAEQMRRHPELDYPLDGLVRASGRSKAAFINAFRLETGFPPHAYLQNCRIEAAKLELAQGCSVRSVADRLGFSSPQHLATQFRKITGCSPLAWPQRKGT